MPIRQTFFAAVLLGPIAANAATIELDPDVYWQVQNASSFNTLCEGFITQCEVEPGIYNIINLTSGERQDGVVVAPQNQPVPGKLEVVRKVCDWAELDWTPIPQEERTFNFADALDCNVSCPAGKILVGVIECSLITDDVISDSLRARFAPTVLTATASQARCSSVEALYPPIDDLGAGVLQGSMTKVTIACQ